MGKLLLSLLHLQLSHVFIGSSVFGEKSLHVNLLLDCMNCYIEVLGDEKQGSLYGIDCKIEDLNKCLKDAFNVIEK